MQTIDYTHCEDSAPIDKGIYQRLVGCLIYLSHTQPNISFVVDIAMSI